MVLINLFYRLSSLFQLVEKGLFYAVVVLFFLLSVIF